MIYNWQRGQVLLLSIVEVDFRGKEVRELASLIDLENRVKIPLDLYPNDIERAKVIMSS